MVAITSSYHFIVIWRYRIFSLSYGSYPHHSSIDLKSQTSYHGLDHLLLFKLTCLWSSFPHQISTFWYETGWQDRNIIISSISSHPGLTLSALHCISLHCCNIIVIVIHSTKPNDIRYIFQPYLTQNQITWDVFRDLEAKSFSYL